ncbi:MAG: hypothetical protein ACRDPE_04575 [Solirubrobacterales bacterium]
MRTGATVPQTTLVLDADLPPNAWETRGEKTKRHRKALDADLFLAALDDPKVKTIAVGDATYLDLLAIMKRSGCKTPTQLAAERRSGVKAPPKKKPVADPFDPSKSSGSPGTFKVDRSTFGGFEPDPPGTSGPGGVAS